MLKDGAGVKVSSDDKGSGLAYEIEDDAGISGWQL
jgi:hypothetical protein